MTEDVFWGDISLLQKRGGGRGGGGGGRGEEEVRADECPWSDCGGPTNTSASLSQQTQMAPSREVGWDSAGQDR